MRKNMNDEIIMSHFKMRMRVTFAYGDDARSVEELPPEISFLVLRSFEQGGKPSRPGQRSLGRCWSP